jgi:hypothetical protein
MPDPTKEQEYREEAERLAQLSIADQRAIIAQHRTIAADPEVTQADRALARERADALGAPLAPAPRTVLIVQLIS